MVDKRKTANEYYFPCKARFHLVLTTNLDSGTGAVTKWNYLKHSIGNFSKE